MGTKSTNTFKWLLIFLVNVNSSFCVLLVLPTKSKQQTNENDQQSDLRLNDDFKTEYSQTCSDFLHSKSIRI
jgi:hypothetical protein